MSTLGTLLTASACVTAGYVVAVVCTGLACKLGILFALAGLAAMLVQFAE